MADVTARTILTMANAQGIDLLNPKVGDIDFGVIAEHLAKVNRFNGATAGVCYSVAEHCIRGADSILRKHNDTTLAAYFLLHDGHEAFGGDDPTPRKEAQAIDIAAALGVDVERICDALALGPYRLDRVIHEAAGLDWPPLSHYQAAIKRWDRIMAVTEWRDLMACPLDPCWTEYIVHAPLPDRIEPLHWMVARDDFLFRCHSLLPCFRKAAA